MNITDFQLMQSFNVTYATQVQLEKLWNKLPNYSTVNYDSLKQQIQKIDDNYPFTISTWPIMLMTVLGTPMTATCITAYCYCKYISYLIISNITNKFKPTEYNNSGSYQVHSGVLEKEHDPIRHDRSTYWKDGRRIMNTMLHMPCIAFHCLTQSKIPPFIIAFVDFIIANCMKNWFHLS